MRSEVLQVLCQAVGRGQQAAAQPMRRARCLGAVKTAQTHENGSGFKGLTAVKQVLLYPLARNKSRILKVALP